VFFFSSRRRHTRSKRDWSSDVCSSDLAMLVLGKVPGSLALTNIAGNAMFGSLSGSGIAAASAMGSVLNGPEKDAGYEEEFSAAKIGRASCRERGECSVGGGGVTAREDT